MNIYSIAATTLLVFISSCSHSPTSSNNPNIITLHVQINDNSITKTNSIGNWQLQSNIVNIESRPKIYYYDFKLTSKTETFIIEDIDYKYGQYGKWRIIEKSKYLPHDKPQISALIRNFPITIKKTGIPHNQLLRLSIKTENDETKTINLVFGTQKCLAKRNKEFVCF